MVDTGRTDAANEIPEVSSRPGDPGGPTGAPVTAVYPDRRPIGQPPPRPPDRPRPPAPERSLQGPQAVLALMVLGYSIGFGWLTWLQQSNFGTWDFDMGVFDQEIWLAAHHLDPFVTIRGLDMWANHVNPIVYLLVPFYWLGAGPHFLYMVQTAAFAAAAIPLWLLARERFGNPWLALGIPMAWLAYPAVEWMTWWHFHPESLGVPAFLFAYWFADRGRWRWYALCVVAVLACKEDAALPVMALGAVLALRHHRRAGIITFLGALAWFVVAVEWIIPAASNASTAFFVSQYSSLGHSAASILYNSVRHPSRVWKLAFAHDRWGYYERLFVPVAGLALLAPVTLLLAVPTLLVNVTNNQGYPHDIRYQYGAFVSAGIFLAVVEAIGRVRRPWLRTLEVAVVCVFALGSNIAWSPSPLDRTMFHSGIWQLAPSAHTRTLDQMVRSVPPAAGVSASYSVVPHLSHRDQIYSWPNPWDRANFGISDTNPPENPSAVQYLVIDMTENGQASAVLLQRLTGPGGSFRVLEARDQDLLAVRVPRSGRPPP